MNRTKNLFDPQGELPLTSATETRCVKRALKADGKGGVCVDCGCGERISMPRINGLPMTYECGKCGLVYGPTGWIIGKREVAL